MNLFIQWLRTLHSVEDLFKIHILNMKTIQNDLIYFKTIFLFNKNRFKKFSLNLSFILNVSTNSIIYAYNLACYTILSINAIFTYVILFKLLTIILNEHVKFAKIRFIPIEQHRCGWRITSISNQSLECISILKIF